MRTRWEQFGALAVALTLATGGLAASTAHAAAATPIEVRAPGIGSFAFSRMQATGSNAVDTDTETADDAAGATENEVSGNEAVDGIDCVQQGEHESENAGC
jgi:hypothetical protein